MTRIFCRQGYTELFCWCWHRVSAWCNVNTRMQWLPSVSTEQKITGCARAVAAGVRFLEYGLGIEGGLGHAAALGQATLAANMAVAERAADLGVAPLAELQDEVVDALPPLVGSALP